MTVAQQDARLLVEELTAQVRPIDERELDDRAEVLRWIRSGAQLYRIVPPATPEQHLCVYFALFDESSRSLLLVDHVKAGLWLFPGGHVDNGEDPRVTALREAREELGLDCRFHRWFGDVPLFVTVTKTRGEFSHTDVSLWFVLAGDDSVPVTIDRREAHEARWFALDDPTAWVPDRFEPHMARFRAKLQRATSSYSGDQ
ncbi:MULTISPECIES: NUDIX hydrolase [Nocardia]|uniref:NUDIX hydrolase n=1 Tax=Nocardia TaxID=1817 RepID=UPI000BF1EC34|nr:MULTISPECIES: NUDIX hydrolase [Nocardia]MBF6187047.1 NUDIX hydrolase [Nocardia farcinica]MBF6312694.1 NUDIX hydrolase [Nocardia farcinica]MBF6408451.1 NUDIX hydrolase [Nocardia farcinica]PEH78911.1 NUDIX hydrolase [Nocardia sp. FDAARGOS_372]UEX23536.1 NUDIX hydrolase [Nocardia farcinica]